MDIDTDTVDTDASDNNSNNKINKFAIKTKIQCGEFKLIKNPGRSKIWEIFFKIEENNGQEVPNVVACNICKSVYSHNGKSTSNLIRHKCYIKAIQSNIVKINIDAKTKVKATRTINKWIVKDCRPYSIVQDCSFQ